MTLPQTRSRFFILAIAAIAALFSATGAWADPQPVQVHIISTGDLDGNSSGIGEAITESIDFKPTEVKQTSNVDEAEFDVLRAALLADGGTSFPCPLDGNGKPLPPPLKLIPGRDGQPNSWEPIKGTPNRPITWKPKYPIPSPTGSQPGGSWDPEHNHWDVDPGNGQPRVRVRPDGTILGPDHEPAPKPTLPDVFPGIDPEIVAKLSCIGAVTVGILGLILDILWGICGGAHASTLPSSLPCRVIDAPGIYYVMREFGESTQRSHSLTRGSCEHTILRQLTPNRFSVDARCYPAIERVHSIVKGNGSRACDFYQTLTVIVGWPPQG